MTELTVIEKYTLLDVEKILSEILDDYELNQVLNKFRAYKKLDTIPEVIKEEFVLPENWYVVVTKENKRTLQKYLEPDGYAGNYKRRWSIGACYGIRNGKYEASTTKDPRDNWVEITFEQFKEYVLNKDTPVINPF